MSMASVNPSTVGVAVAAGAVGVAAGYAFAHSGCLFNEPSFTRVGTVSELSLYPVKSCAPILVKEATCGPVGLQNGLIRDRVFLITDQKYHFITARQENRLVLVKPSFHDNELWLDAPGMETFKLTIPTKEGEKFKSKIHGNITHGIDCGLEVAEWFERFLKREPNSIRLLYHPWTTSERTPDHWNRWDRFQKKDTTIYGDLCPVLLLPDASLKDLNTRLDKKVSALNFRANILVDGSHPYDEDFWTHVKVGETSFRCVRPSTRCILTTIDPETGVKGDEPLKTLKTYRQIKDPKYRKMEGESPRFGVYLGPDKLGTIRIGDTVFAAY